MHSDTDLYFSLANLLFFPEKERKKAKTATKKPIKAPKMLAVKQKSSTFAPPIRVIG
jgi:hypothetical protein